MKPILEVRNIWKQYKIGGKQQRYKSLRENLFNVFQYQPKSETFWALQDISFDVYEGDCIGIIGRNGAGKSTLLKILSKITPPTKGFIKARGRIASLLEVGTGFHPELTGRENIYLNGSILGLRKSEINRKFDEIVDFSGVEQFLDTSLKHYSSGMQLRLAFSVAAHLEPEILLIDEVLAVGDAEFQKKCLGKMDEVSKNGRTILFVSHNISTIKTLCTKGILLKQGKIQCNGNLNKVMNEYLASTQKNHKTYPLNSPLQYIKVEQEGQHLKIYAKYQLKTPMLIPSLGFVFFTQQNQPLFGFNPTLDKSNLLNANYPKQGSLEIIIKEPKLVDGIYIVSIWFGNGFEDFVIDKHCLQIEVVNMAIYKQQNPKHIGHIVTNCFYSFK